MRPAPAVCKIFCLLVHKAADKDRFYTSNVFRSAKPNFFGPVEREASKVSLPASVYNIYISFLEVKQPAHYKVSCCDQDNCNGGQGKLEINLISFIWLILLMFNLRI